MANPVTSADSAAAFYDGLAAEYDAMTGFSARLVNARRWATEVAARLVPAGSVVDVATGTGLYAIAFAGLGFEVTGADIATEMLALARKNAESAGVKATWLQTDMQSLAGCLAKPAGLLVCLGNSLPHLTQPEALATALCEFRNALAPGGVAVVQVLNYDKILRVGERMVSVDRQGDTEFVRFYDFLPESGLVRFNVLRLRWQGNEAVHDWQSVTLQAYTKAELEQALATAGFTEITAYSGLSFKPFDPTTSDTLTLVARRGGEGAPA